MKGDLVKRHLAENPACQCGYQCENSEHYLFHCPLFNDARSASINKINNVNYTLNCLLFGNQNLSIVENSEIFQHVSNYIILSKRFVQWCLLHIKVLNFDVDNMLLTGNFMYRFKSKQLKVNPSCQRTLSARVIFAL